MKNIDLIGAAVAIIEENLKTAITVYEVSKKTGYSYFHFSRLFQSITGYNPQDYIVKRRLTEAADDLIHSDRKIIDIALDYQFNSPEAFSRAIKRLFALTPLEIRKKKKVDPYKQLSPLDIKTIKHTAEIKAYETKEVDMPALTIAGLSCFMKGKDTTISLLWEKLLQDAKTIRNRKKPERYYQVCFWSDEHEMEGLFLMAGMEVKSATIHNPAYVVKRIPAGRYLKFIHKGFSNQVGLTYQYIYKTYLPKTEYRLTKSYNFEYYGERFLGPFHPESESEIYIPID